MDAHDLGGIQARNLRKRAVADPRLDRAVTGLRIVYCYEIYWCVSRRMDDTK